MPVTRLQRAPVSNPRPQVTVDGAGSPWLDELLLGLDMREQEGGLAALELRLSNVASLDEGGTTLAFEDERLIALGSRIAVATGAQDESREIFRGLVTGLEAEFPGDGPPELVVLAEDALQAARMSRRTQVHVDTSLGDLARRVAECLGLRAEVSVLDDIVATWVQLNESDLAFLRRLLRGRDADLQVNGDQLVVAPHSEIARELIDMTLHEDLRRVRFVADLAHQVTAVTSAGWNPQQGETVSGRGEGRHLGPGQGRSGAQLLRQTLGGRVEHVGQVAVNSREEAQALADAVFDRRARGFVTAEGSANGHPLIRAGCRLALRGVGARFENTYFVTATHHRYSVREGYMTDFRAECAWLGEPT